MRYRVALPFFVLAAGLFAQAGIGGPPSGNRSALSVTPSSPKPAARGPIGPGWGRQAWLGGGWWGGGGYWGHPAPARSASEPKEERKEDKLKELIISPVYQPAKVNPKMIEIP